jgi:tetratricopeptide (TPR) repeat protein
LARATPVTIAFLCASAVAFALEVGPAPSARIARLNEGFLKHLDTLGPNHARAVEVIRESWKRDYTDQPQDGFVPDALAVLYPTFRAALAAFDDGRYEAVETALAPLLTDIDPYLRANAGYFHARALIERGLLEEAESFLTDFPAPADSDLGAYTPYAAHLVFLKGFCEASNLRFDAAKASLAKVRERFADAPEAVSMGAQQLRLELERRETGNLGEVAGLLDYASARLDVTDTQARVRQRQDEAIALLDKLIKEAEQQEQASSSSGGGGGRGGRGGRKAGMPKRPTGGAEESAAPAGAGQIGDLHAAGKANPGEMWGKMPEADREKILQSLRERFPSRYRQLDEQYYRSLAEEK